MKAKAKTALEWEEKAALYARRKVEAESVFGHIKGNRSFRRFSLRGLDKVHVEFGIVALAHNILKVAGIRQLLSDKNRKNIKASGEKRMVFLHLLHFRDLSDSPFYYENGEKPKDKISLTSFISRQRIFEFSQVFSVNSNELLDH